MGKRALRPLLSYPDEPTRWISGTPETVFSRPFPLICFHHVRRHGLAGIVAPVQRASPPSIEGLADAAPISRLQRTASKPILPPSAAENAAQWTNARSREAAPQRSVGKRKSALGRQRPQSWRARVSGLPRRLRSAWSPLPSLKLVAGKLMLVEPQTEIYAQRLRLTRM